ncbi:hypothetical protein LX36DRAFT_475314 [Colletotrichum falcatum]|nr:hypothetical protein LX36DRAFT_475314 [Colletotrichum falcatum]
MCSGRIERDDMNEKRRSGERELSARPWMVAAGEKMAGDYREERGKRDEQCRRNWRLPPRRNEKRRIDGLQRSSPSIIAPSWPGVRSNKDSQTEARVNKSGRSGAHRPQGPRHHRDKGQGQLGNTGRRNFNFVIQFLQPPCLRASSLVVSKK